MNRWIKLGKALGSLFRRFWQDQSSGFGKKR